MSELLRLREWLGFDDAMRYAKHLGLNATKIDFFLTYTEAKFPLKLARGRASHLLCSIVPSTANTFPAWPSGVWNRELRGWKGDCGVIYAIYSDVEPSNPFSLSFDEREVVLIMSPFPGVSIAPCFWAEPGDKFQTVVWRDLIGEDAGNVLAVSTKHVEMIVRRALGQPETATQETAQMPQPAPLPPFCDNTHESYPTELHTAFMLWEALYIKGEKNQNHPHQQAAKLWLGKNKDKLPTADLANADSDAMRDRLVTITTPSAKKAKK